MWEHLTLYPDIPQARRRQELLDLLVAGLVLLFAWIGMRVHDLVAALSVLGTGVSSAGSTIQSGFNAVGGAMGKIPVVGGSIGQVFTSVGQSTGGNLTSVGQQGTDAVNLLANGIGLVTAGLPIIVLLVTVLPRRWYGIQEMTAARGLAGQVDLADPEKAKLIAMRAAFGLPYSELIRYTADPFGDLAAGRYDALITAALADVGLLPQSATESVAPPA